MPIKFSCPECQKSLKVEERLIGKRVHCPSCQAAITIPVASTDAAKEPAPTSDEVARKPATKKTPPHSDVLPATQTSRAAAQAESDDTFERFLSEPVPAPATKAGVSRPSPIKSDEPVAADEFADRATDNYGLRKPTKSAPSADKYRPQLSKPKQAAAVRARGDEHPSRTSASGSGGSRRHLHWLLALALVPLALSMFWKDESTLEPVQELIRELDGLK